MNSICLPLEGKKYYFNESARIAGWGQSKEGNVSSMPSKLLTTDILVSNRTECVQSYVQVLKSERAKERLERESEDFIRSNYRNTRDTCQSDSGGPLMQYADRKAVAIGIVSYGVGCATRGVAGLYTRTSAYIEWIKAIAMRGRSVPVDSQLLEADPSGPGGGSTKLNGDYDDE